MGVEGVAILEGCGGGLFSRGEGGEGGGVLGVEVEVFASAVEFEDVAAGVSLGWGVVGGGDERLDGAEGGVEAGVVAGVPQRDSFCVVVAGAALGEGGTQGEADLAGATRREGARCAWRPGRARPR